jgi:hypothetical protein
MREHIQTTQPYTLAILHKTSKRDTDPSADKIIWEHGRKNFQLRKEGKLRIVCPIRDETNVSGIGIFATNVEETRKILDQDPAVQAGILTYETHSTRSFPRDSL